MVFGVSAHLPWQKNIKTAAASAKNTLLLIVLHDLDVTSPVLASSTGKTVWNLLKRMWAICVKIP